VKKSGGGKPKNRQKKKTGRVVGAIVLQRLNQTGHQSETMLAQGQPLTFKLTICETCVTGRIYQVVFLCGESSIVNGES
jgi:hypothetical protein